MRPLLAALGCIILFASCASTKKVSIPSDDGVFEMNFIQVNDVYEIAPMSGGKEAGMARVATLKKNLQKDGNPVVLLMAGDFYSPSVYNSLRYQGQRIRGRQMVEAMNAANFALAIFGNHEFDITAAEFQSRLNESAFGYISSNVFRRMDTGYTFFRKYSSNDSTVLPQWVINTYTDNDGTTARIGFIGITLPFNKADYVSYRDPLEVARELYNSLRDSCDALIAITHQLMEDDVKLADSVPGFAAIMGGHEHDMRFARKGDVYITKAHANARTAYVTALRIDKKSGKVSADPQLVTINDQIAEDSLTKLVVEKWTSIADSSFSSIGFDARKVVYQDKDSLDARESVIRYRESNLTRMMLEGMMKASPDADVVIFNSGSIRLDDILYSPVTQYDIIRTLPYGGPIVEVKMKGTLLLQVLEAGRLNKGIGGFLHAAPARFDIQSGRWLLSTSPIVADSVYRVAMSDFLLTGGEANMGFLTRDNAGIVEVLPAYGDPADARSDIRLSLIRFMETAFPSH